jgi:hypothetical protein
VVLLVIRGLLSRRHASRTTATRPLLTTTKTRRRPHILALLTPLTASLHLWRGLLLWLLLRRVTAPKPRSASMLMATVMVVVPAVVVMGLLLLGLTLEHVNAVLVKDVGVGAVHQEVEVGVAVDLVTQSLLKARRVDAARDGLRGHFDAVNVLWSHPCRRVDSGHFFSQRIVSKRRENFVSPLDYLFNLCFLYQVLPIMQLLASRKRSYLRRNGGSWTSSGVDSTETKTEVPQNDDEEICKLVIQRT